MSVWLQAVLGAPFEFLGLASIRAGRRKERGDACCLDPVGHDSDWAPTDLDAVSSERANCASI